MLSKFWEFLNENEAPRAYARGIRPFLQGSEIPRSRKGSIHPTGLRPWFSAKGDKFIFLLLFLLVAATYVNSIHNEFVVDDIPVIAANPLIGSPENIFPPLSGFVQRSFYFLAHQVGGLNPAPYRLINIFFHLGSVFCLFAILNLLSGRTIATMTAMLFAVHPILVESVGWISGSLYVQYAFFFLLSFLLYILGTENRKYYFASLSIFALSLLASEKAVPLFLVFFLYEIAFGNPKKNWKKTMPYAILAAAGTALYFGGLGQRIDTMENVNRMAPGLDNPFQVMPIAVFFYLKLLLWPAKLTLYHTEMIFTTKFFIFMACFSILFFAAILWGYRRNRYVFFWLSFFIISLLATLTPFRISWVVAERYVYLGSAGIMAAAAWILNGMAKNRNWRGAIFAIFSLIVISLSIRTVIRNRDWKNEDNLIIASAKVSRHGFAIHKDLGEVYRRQGKIDEAISELKKAIAMNPRYADAYHNLGNTYQQIGNFKEAIANYEKAVEFNPGLWQTYYNLCAVYYQLGRYNLAYRNIKKAIKLNPNDKNLREIKSLLESQGSYPDE